MPINRLIHTQVDDASSHRVLLERAQARFSTVRLERTQREIPVYS